MFSNAAHRFRRATKNGSKIDLLLNLQRKKFNLVDEMTFL